MRRVGWPSGSSAGPAPWLVEGASWSVQASAIAGNTSGAGMRVIDMLAVPDAPLADVTDAVTRCTPVDRLLAVTSRPVPMKPSRSETHTTLAGRSPASSTAVARKVTGAPDASSAPGAGAVMVTSGGRADGPAVITTTTESTPVSPRLSAACALMRCVPRERRAVVTALPVPIGPSRLETQRRFDPRSPSAGSLAAARNVSGVQAGTLVPFDGARTVTVGGVLPATTVTLWLAVSPSLSVTVAVITCRPTARRGTVTEAPVPSRPATSDVQRIVAARFPSRKSIALPASVTGPATELPSAGERMARTGGGGGDGEADSLDPQGPAPSRARPPAGGGPPLGGMAGPPPPPARGPRRARGP